MRSELVPPTYPTTRETIIANTKPNSLERKMRLALFDLGFRKYIGGFPYVLWLLDKKDKNKK